MAFKNIALEIDQQDGIALIRLERPEKLNALNHALLDELAQAFEAIGKDTGVRALILTGSGEKAFVAGADIDEMAEINALAAADLADWVQGIFRQLETCGKPSVAAINGYALGGGLELALACTMRVAASNAKLGQPEVKLGLIPGYGATQRLPHLTGRGRALELMLTGETIDATEAHRIGLVNHVVAPQDLLDFSRSLLRKVLANAPVAVRLVMQAVDVGLNSGPDQGFRFEAMAFGLAASTEDRLEGMKAFLEKRPALFTGK